MSKLSVIEFAEKRLQESADERQDYLMTYWSAYLDGARAQKREDEKLKKQEA